MQPATDLNDLSALAAPQGKPLPRLHQQLYGIEAVEIDHAENIAYAWYGGVEILAINCADGTIRAFLSIDDLGIVWSLDKAELKARVEAALVGLKSTPNYFGERIAKSQQPPTRM